MTVVLSCAGAALVVLVLLDIFQSVVVPRPTGRRWRPSAYLTRIIWQAWRWFAHRIVDNDAREDALGMYAPFMLVFLLAFWIAALVVGYGTIFFGLRGQLHPAPTYAGALYFAGTSLLTIGYGDIVPTGPGARLISLFAGASGFGSFAIITTFLFAIFGAYQQREAYVLMFSNRAGAPPSGVEMLESHANLNIIDSLVLTMRESQLWMSQVMETHLAYPILTYFRSTHDNISWIAVFGTMLDVSTLIITTLDVPTKGEAIVVNRLGRHFVNDFARYFRFPAGSDVGLERAEFDTAYDRLHAADVPLRERERAWKEFVAIRATYASQLNLMAQFWRIPPAQWIGDRSLLSSHHVPLDIGLTTLPESVATIET